MTGIFKKSVLAAALAATTLASATPALADPYRGPRRHNGDDTAAAAVLGGIIGLTIGVIAASVGKKKHHRCDRYRDDDHRCYRDYNGSYNGGAYGNYPQQGGYYERDGRIYDRDGREYSRDGRYADRDGRYEDQDEYRADDRYGRQGY